MRPFWVALCISVLLHVGLFIRLSGLSQTVNFPSVAGGIQVNLVQKIEKTIALDASAPSSIASIGAQVITTSERAAPQPKAARMRDKLHPVSTVSSQAGSQPAQPVVPAASANQQPGRLQSGDQIPAMYVDMAFDLYLGAERQFAGGGRQQYVSDGAGHYGLSIGQIAPESASSDEPWQLEISGDIVPQGLSPSLFELKGNLPERLIGLKGPEVDLPRSNVRSGRMPDGILDRQSLLYQFMQRPPVAGGGKLTLSDGSKHGEYNYTMAGAETIRVSTLGDVRTIKLIITSTDSAELIELWLMPESHYLPAKVRYVDERGVITEQLVVSISFK